MTVPNRQPRADGQLVSIDSKSCTTKPKRPASSTRLFRVTKCMLRLASSGMTVDEHSGMAEIAGVVKESIKVWSQRSTRLREWAKKNLIVVDGEPTAAQVAAAQKATRPAKPETLAWADLKEQWACGRARSEIGP